MPEFPSGPTQADFDRINAEFEETQNQQVENMMDTEVAPPAAPVEAPVEAPPVAPIAEEPAEKEPNEREAGKDGSVRDVAGAVKELASGLNEPTFMTQAADAVAGLFGMGSPEERQQQRTEGRAELESAAQKAIDRDPAGAAVADTLVRAVPGGAIDAVEDSLSALEVIGDTVKTFATLGNVHESQNPFSSNYDWAQWKLGADEIGAKTKVGEFAQELVSFAAIGSRMGAFKSFQGATKGVKGALKTGAIEAAYGMAADAIKGLAGEGNFANMLENMIPGLKDTWVTALAVDEDDNPWESAVKSALDGAAIGFPTGVIGAMASGARAAKKVTPAEIKANPRAAEEAYLNKFNEVLKQTELKLGNTKVKELKAEDVFMEASEGDLSRLNQLSVEQVTSLQKNYDLGAFIGDEQFARALAPDVQQKIFGRSTTPKVLKNGSTIDWLLTDMPEARRSVAGIEGPDHLRIDWEISDADADAGGLGEGAAGTEMFKQVREVLKDNNVEPGRIIGTEAATDAKGGVQGASEAQRRNTKNKAAKEWIKKNDAALQEQYLKDIGETDPEYWTGLDTQDKWDYFDGRKVEGVEDFKGPVSKREQIYQRAGLAPADKNGMMWGIVRTDKKGRRILEPLDLTKDIDEQIAKAKERSYVQKSLHPALEVVEERVAAKVPVYWDDVAATIPEKFTPGTRVIDNPEFSPEAIKALRDPGEGVTVDPFTGIKPTEGFMVAIDGKSLTSFDPEDISDFIAQNYDILTREDVFLGGWISELTGKPVFELSRRVDTLDEAKALGDAFDQEGIFDVTMQTGDKGYTPTGGLDRLKETRGFHQRSAYTQKNYVREPGDAQNIARTQFASGADSNPGVIGGRIMTDEQLHILGDALPEYASKQLDEVIRGMDVHISDVVAESRISQKELMERVSYDLSDFIGADRRIDLSKLPMERYGDDSILTRQSALQVRVLMKNIAGTIWTEATNIGLKDGQNINSDSSMEIMVDGLKALARLRKKSVNIFGVRLADEGMPLEKGSIFETVFQPKKAAEKTERANAFNMPEEALDQIDKTLDDMMAGFKSGDPKRIRQAKRAAEFLVLTGGDISKMGKVAKGIGQLYGDVALKHMYNSLLSSPATHLVNNLSNFTNTFARPIQAAMGGKPRAAIASFYNFNEMLSESFDLAWRTFKGDNIAQGSKIASAGETRIALDNLAEKVSLGTASNAERINSGILHMFYDLAEWPALSWPSKFLTTSDEFFKAMNARMEYRVQNYMEAANVADGDPQKLFEELMVKNKDLAFGNKTGAVMDPKLLDVAQELTFQTKLEGSAGRFAAFVNENAALRPFFPFVKTGHNIMVFTGTHTPILNLALSESRRALRGELGPYAQAVHRGRFAMGTMTVAAAGMALAAGRLTGTGPAEKNARDAWLRTNEPRSIKIGDTWYSYDRIEPFGLILNSLADLYYAMNAGELEHDQGNFRAQYLMYAISSNISNKTFFQGIKDLSVILNPSGPGALRRLESILIGTGNNFVPAAGLRRAAFNAFTPYMQEYHKIGDKHKQQLGMEIVPPADRIEFLDGSKIPTSQGGFLNAILPIKAVTKPNDIVRDGLALIEFDQASIRKEINEVDLTPKQSNRLNELMAETGLYDDLKTIMSDPKWAVAVKEYNDSNSNVPKETYPFYSLITGKIRKAQETALKVLLEEPENAELREAYYHNKFTRQKARMGQIGNYLHPNS